MKNNKRKSVKSRKGVDKNKVIINVEIGNLEDKNELELLKQTTVVALGKLVKKYPKVAVYEFHYVIIFVEGYSVEGFVDIKKPEGQDVFEVTGLKFCKIEQLSDKDKLIIAPDRIEIQLYCILSIKPKKNNGSSGLLLAN